jgi:hypothetical protein
MLTFRVKYDTLRAILFGSVIAVYAFLSSSTPDKVGIAEVCIGSVLVVLLFSAGVRFWVGRFPANNVCSPYSGVYLGSLYVVFVPAVWGLLVKTNGVRDFVRDIIPLWYFFLPLLFLPLIKNKEIIWRNRLIVSICVIGVCYSLRFLMIDPGNFTASIGKTVFFGDRNYFQMDPAVIFSAIFLTVYALTCLLDGKFRLGFCAAILGGGVYLVIVASVVRAQIVLVPLAFIGALLLIFVRRPIKVLAISIPLAILGYIYVNPMLGLLAPAIAKTASVGLANSRDAEMLTVLNNAASGLSPLLMGEGWGGLIRTSASAGNPVRFVHNSLAYFLFKAGILGLCAILPYYWWIGRSFVHSFPVARKDPIVFSAWLASFGALSLNLVFEPGYKMFSMGLVLTLLATLQCRGDIVKVFRHSAKLTAHDLPGGTR